MNAQKMSHRSKRNKTQMEGKGASPRPIQSRATGHGTDETFDIVPKNDVSTHAGGQQQVPTEDLLCGNEDEVEVKTQGKEGEPRADWKIDQDTAEGDQEPRGNRMHAHLLESGTTTGDSTWEIVMNDKGMDQHDIDDKKKKLSKSFITRLMNTPHRMIETETN
jgi:hypothetical protein